MSVLPAEIITKRGPTKAPLIQLEFGERFTFAASNGTTAFGRVPAGTIVGVDANGRVRPCALTSATATTNTSTATVESTAGFRVGDSLFINGVDSGSTVTSIPSATSLGLSGTESIADGDVIGVGDSSDTPIGVLAEDVDTLSPDNGQNYDQSVVVAMRGVIVEGEVTGDLAACAPLLPGLTFVSR